MSIEIGKTYKTLNGKRSFCILGKKKISPTGFFFIGEDTKLGLVAYFNHKGEHSHQSEYWLDIDPYLYVPVNEDGSLAVERFIPKRDIPEGRFMGYLKLDPVGFNTIHFVGTNGIS
jgi:hypothetical protein